MQVVCGFHFSRSNDMFESFFLFFLQFASVV